MTIKGPERLPQNLKDHTLIEPIVQGPVNFTQVEQFKAGIDADIQELTDSQKPLKLVLDLSRIDSMQAAGLRVLREFLHTLKDKKGEIVLADTQEKVLESMSLMGYSTLFQQTTLLPPKQG